MQNIIPFIQLLGFPLLGLIFAFISKREHRTYKYKCLGFYAYWTCIVRQYVVEKSIKEIIMPQDYSLAESWMGKLPNPTKLSEIGMPLRLSNFLSDHDMREIHKFLPHVDFDEKPQIKVSNVHHNNQSIINP